MCSHPGSVGQALQLGHQLVIQVVCNHGRDCSSFNIFAPVIWILWLQLQVLNNEAWPLFFNKVQSLGMVTKFGGIDPDKVDLAMIFGSHGPEGIDVVLALLFIGINKVVLQQLAIDDIDTICVTVDLIKDGDSHRLMTVWHKYISLETRNHEQWTVYQWCDYMATGLLLLLPWSFSISSHAQLILQHWSVGKGSPPGHTSMALIFYLPGLGQVQASFA